MHRLLARQLMKLGIQEDAPISAEQLAELLAIVTRTYNGLNEDRLRLEHSLQMTSDELLGLNKDLREERDRLARQQREIRKQNEELLAAKDAAVASNRAKAQFLANMSHEIRTPMNGVIGMTDVLLSGELSEELRAQLQIINQSGQAMLSVINDILDFSKIEAKKMTLELAPFCLQDVVEEVLSIHAAAAYSKGIELISQVDPRACRFLVGDAYRLRQVLLNLVSNAVKFTDSGSVVVSAELARKEDHTLVQLVVSDTGIGIPEEQLGKVFHSFAQVDGGMSRKYGGTGLGLSIAGSLVELMGGQMTLTSTLNEGTTFTIQLELQELPPAKATEQPLKGVPVMVVSPYESRQATLERTLHMWGGKLVTEPSRASVVIRECNSACEAAKGSAKKEILLVPPAGFTWSGVSPEAQRLPKWVSPKRLLAGLERALQTDTERQATGPQESKRLDLKVLVVEDSPVNQLVIKKMLEKLGSQVELAANGQIGYEMATSGSYDLILMDCQMPEMDGYEATAAIRKWETENKKAPLPIIALTAHVGEGEREHCLASGMDGYLTKPVKIDEVLEAVTALLDTRQVA